ncbi:PQQ-binding-like beta-propeller repeat protein [Runella sp.]|uniref:outer membrane protein assembly factor BamB family protein n=1 Tax=Runella sp. TaxID=1960881 RepID=UPI003D09F9C5
MKKVTNGLLLLFVLLNVSLAGCIKKKTEPTPVTKSSAKDITEFSFVGISPAINATIDASAKTIKAELPIGTDLTKLVPTITVSDKATVSPATGAAQDFSKTVTYTVTAENGTTQVYTVTVSIVNNGTVYIGNLDGVFYAIDALTGAKKWEFKTGGSINSTPTVVNGMVFFASWDKKIYALDAATGAKKWESNPTAVKLLQPFAAPMVVNDALYYVGETALYSLDAGTGVKKWEFVGDGVYSWQASPMVANGIVYGIIRGNTGGKYGMYALDATTGAVKWGPATDVKLSESSPAIANGVVFAGSESNGLVALDATTGATKWKFDSGLITYSSPTVANGVVYVGAGGFGTNKDNDKLYAVEATTGVKKWEFKTPDGGSDYSSPMVAGGIAYIGAGGTLYALDAATGTKKWEAKPDVGNLITSGPVVATALVYLGIGKKLYAFDAATGAKKWEYDTGRTIDQSSPCVVAKDGTIYHAGISGMVQ